MPSPEVVLEARFEIPAESVPRGGPEHKIQHDFTADGVRLVMTLVSFDDDLDWEFAFDSRLGHPTGRSEEPMAKRSKKRSSYGTSDRSMKVFGKDSSDSATSRPSESRADGSA